MEYQNPVPGSGCLEIQVQEFKGTKKELRDILKEALQQYVSDTFSYIHTVQNFTNRSTQWEKARKAEVTAMTNIQKCNDVNVLKDKLTETLSGLNEMEPFLDAVEKLAVTSDHVFKTNKTVLEQSTEANLEAVSIVILAARLIGPLLIRFKRNNKDFFSPKLDNIEVLQGQLEHYISTINTICSALEKSSLPDLSLNKPVIDIKKRIPKSAIKNMLSHIRMISKIRMDEDFRMVYLFSDQHQIFINEFIARRTKMLVFLRELEGCADQLESMNKGAHISGVVSSSVGVAGGLLSFLGLVCAPATFGGSFALTGVGAAMGAVSGVNKIVTTATEVGVNKAQNNKAEVVFSNFMEDVNKIQGHLDGIIHEYFHRLDIEELITAAKRIGESGVQGMKKPISNMIKMYKDLKAGQLVGNAVQGGKAAGKGITGVLDAAKSGAVAFLFIGLDIYQIVEHSKSLLQGTETESSKFIRAKVALWHSEIISWEKNL